VKIIKKFRDPKRDAEKAFLFFDCGVINHIVNVTVIYKEYRVMFVEIRPYRRGGETFSIGAVRL